jgi:glycosyltransferase involved in cell wall biosynthesis
VAPETRPAGRILLVGPYPPPYGGMATHVVGLAPYLARRGFEVTILSMTLGRPERLRPAPGVEVLRVNGLQALRDWRTPVVALRLRHRWDPRDREWIAREVASTNAVGRIVEERGIGLVVSYMITSSLFVPHLRRRFGSRVKFMTMVFGELVERSDVIGRNRPFYRQILDESDHLVATSAYCAGLVSTLGADPSRVEVIYVGVDIDRFGTAVPARPPGLPSGGLVVLFVGRFHDEMGLDVLLDAIPAAVAAHRDLRFVLAGAPGPLSARAADVERRYPGHVFVRPNVAFGALPAYYSAADILVAPTRDQHACMGVSIKEAMAAGKAIVTTRSGGIPEAVLDGVCGTVLDFDGAGRLDPAALTRAMGALAADPDTRARFGRAAKERAAALFGMNALLARNAAACERLIGTLG